jgi:hypothetical protein
MSTWFIETIVCPACGASQEARLARGVHVARAPEVREQVLDRTFHRVTCVACALRFVALRPLVYTDIDRKHWIYVALASERPRWPELEDAAAAIFDQAFNGSPLAIELAEGFKQRVVFGMEELREKLVIWRAGYDDAVFECVKLQLLERRPGLAREQVVVDTIDDQVILTGAPEPIAIERTAVEDAHDRRAELSRRFPELFHGHYVSTHRLLGHRYRPA